VAGLLLNSKRREQGVKLEFGGGGTWASHARGRLEGGGSPGSPQVSLCREDVKVQPNLVRSIVGRKSRFWKKGKRVLGVQTRGGKLTRYLLILRRDRVLKKAVKKKGDDLSRTSSGGLEGLMGRESEVGE